MDWRDLLPGITGSFVGVMGWLLVGLYIQRRQFVRQARNAAKAVYFELDVNLAALAVARDHGLFADLDRSSFERLPSVTCKLTRQAGTLGRYLPERPTGRGQGRGTQHRYHEGERVARASFYYPDVYPAPGRRGWRAGG